MMLSARRLGVLVAGAVVLAGLTPAAHGQQSFTNPTPIGIPGLGPAGTYPSRITVTGLKRGVAHVTVNLRAVFHTYPSDLGFLLVGPHGQTCLLTNRCGPGLVPLTPPSTYCLDDDAATGNPNTWPLSGCYRPTNCGGAVTFSAPAPPPPYGTTLSVFDGTDGNGEWALYIQDFAANDSGNMDNGWSVNITEAGTPLASYTASYIEIPVGMLGGATFGPGNPYPSQIVVSGLTGKIDSVAVRLNDVDHTYPGDMDVLLVGPNGQRVMIMSDAGSITIPVAHAYYAFTNLAAGPMPLDAAPVSGTYQPTDYFVGDAMPAPAPAGPYISTMATFKGANPNGTWSLYVNDDANGDSGIIRSWQLSLYLAEPCEADFNKSGSLTVADIFAFLTAWFAGCP